MLKQRLRDIELGKYGTQYNLNGDTGIMGCLIAIIIILVFVIFIKIFL